MQLNFPLTSLIFFGLLLPNIALSDHVTAGNSLLEILVVTATREANPLADIAASVGVISEEHIVETNPSHASELLNRIPGVNIVQLGSSAEGTAAAIRQPVSYGPVYLYLENGVPTRSAGFFNHNALYGMNVSAANGIEVIKGPGSALYGSDAIGAVINLLTGQPPKEDALHIGLETGGDGWHRAQLRAAKLTAKHGFTARLDVSEYDGWRDHTSSNKQAFTGSWNTVFSDSLTVNTVFSATDLDYETGGSGLLYEDYKNNPKQPGNLIAYRQASAFRLSSAFEKVLDNGVLTVTPFLRSNQLEYLAHWTLNSGRSSCPSWNPDCAKPILDSQDAHINESGHDSLGILVKYRYNLGPDSVVISGIDVDYSEGDVKQTYIERTDNDPGIYWQAYQPADLLYNFDVKFLSLSPYIHGETQINAKLRLSAGLRYDTIRYDYHNSLSVDIDDSLHKRLPDQSVDMDHLSPKLSAIYQFSDGVNGYAAYRHAFRVPSSGQLFRSGQTEDSSNLEPVKADSYELGLRGNINTFIAFDSAIYYMTKENDILTITDQASGGRRNANAGETEHYGIELGIDVKMTEAVNFYIAYTRTEHKYKEWQDRSGDFSGNDMPDAPEDFANVQLNYRPLWLNGGRMELEWVHQGEHWLDESNADDNNTNDRDHYNGHDLLNARADYWPTSQLNLYVRVLNLTNELYAETTSKWGPQYTPGRPRSAFVGFRYEF
ncbi:MAG: outer membrane receptor protein involved in Fe transport [Pseudohongiellaceae bacterium]|jgi:outer membrane receptor protein involved in Fe transport